MRQPCLQFKGGSLRGYTSRADADLVAACLRGDETAWNTLIDRYKGLIYKLALNSGLSPADASDVLQEVSLLLVDHLGELRDGSKVAHWLAITTKREVWRLLRRRKPTADLTTLEYLPATGDAGSVTFGASDPEAATIAIEDQLLVRQALDRLPSKCRALMEALYCSDPPCSYAEAASRLGMPVNSVGPNRIRCLNTLKKLLMEQGF
jgi:RNA polymerase sigma factor (sigma-70 family)